MRTSSLWLFTPLLFFFIFAIASATDDPSPPSSSSFLSLSLPSSALSPAKDEPTTAEEKEKIHEAFQRFMKDYQKSYPTKEERTKAMQNFAANWRELNGLLQSNANPEATFGVTKFFDMSLEEFARYPCGGDLATMGLPEEQVDEEELRKMTGVLMEDVIQGKVPDSWDWTEHIGITVKDQKACGSCWAFSTVGNVEGMWTKAGHHMKILSEQEFVDCSLSNHGCNGGWPFLAMGDIMKKPEKGMINTDEEYPYTARDESCVFRPKSAGVRIAGHTSYCRLGTQPCHPEMIKALVYRYGPVSACLNALPLVSYQSGILDPEKCKPDFINHCVTIVGYGEEKGLRFWKLKNSWGTEYGEDGFVRLAQGKCGVERVITVAKLALH
ncbi:Papaya proteinase 4 [Balamuthia mandrillaris]